MPAALAMAGGSFHQPPEGGSRTPSRPASFGMYAVVNRPCSAAGTLNPVSTMPSGSKRRSRRNTSSGRPVARSSRTPSTCAPVL